MVDRSVVVRVVADTTAYTAGMSRAAAATSTFARQTAAQSAVAANSVKNVGTQAGLLPAAFSTPTLAAAGALGFMAKAAIDWETAWTGVTKTVEGTPEQMAALEGELRNLATTLPSSHTEIAAVAEAAGQLGIQTENVDEFTETMLNLGNTTNLSAEEAATALARFMNIMGTSQGDVERLGSSVVELGNNYATTEAEIVDMATRIASSGRQIGLTEADVFGLATALSSVGIEAEAGGTSISRVLNDMAKAVDTGNDKLTVFAAVAGESVGEFKQRFDEDAGSAVSKFLEGLAAIQASGQSIQPFLEELGFTDVRVGNALRSAASAGPLFADAMDTANDAFEENVALTEEAEKRYDTMASRLDVAKNKIRDAAIELGGPLAESFADIATVIGNTVGGLNDFNQELKTTVAESQSIAAELDMGEGWSLDYNIGDLLGDAGRVFYAFKLQLTEGTDAANEWWYATSGQGGAADDASAAIENQGNQYERLAGQAGEAEDSTYDIDAAMDVLGGTAADAADEIEALKDAIEAFGDEAIATDAAHDELTRAIKEAKQPFRDLEDAQRNLADAEAELAAADSDAARKSAAERVEREKSAVAAAEAAITLKGNSDAALDNRDRLRELATQAGITAAAFIDGTAKGANKARRETKRARDEFVETAIQMGYTKDEAKALADEYGLIPKKVTTTVQTNGIDNAIGKAREYRNLLLEAIVPVPAAIAAPQRRADGGYIAGPGGPKDDRIPAMLSNGEYVLAADAVARLGVPFLDALNAGRSYGFAQGGYVGRTASETITRSESIHIGQVVAHDYHDFRRQMDREQRVRALPGATR